jgi:hypothetical protein
MKSRISNELDFKLACMNVESILWKNLTCPMRTVCWRRVIGARDPTDD